MPYLVLVLAALLVETRRPRAGAPVLALLGACRAPAARGVAVQRGLPRRGSSLSGERDPGRLARLAALAAAAPVLWALSDLVVTGDPLHSLTGTRDTAATLGRITGLDDVPLTVPRRLGEILREPVLVGAAGGGLLRAVAPARPRPPGGRGRRRCARRLLRPRRGRPADPRALPAAARGDPRDLLRRRRLRLARAAARAPAPARLGVVRRRHPRAADRLRALAGRPSRRPCATRSRARARSRTTSATSCAVRRARSAPRARRSRCPTTAPFRCSRCGWTRAPGDVVAAQVRVPRARHVRDPGDGRGGRRLRAGPARPRPAHPAAAGGLRAGGGQRLVARAHALLTRRRDAPRSQRRGARCAR